MKYIQETNVVHVTSPFPKRVGVSVFADGWVSLHHIAKALGIDKVSFIKYFNGPTEVRVLPREQSPYKCLAKGHIVQKVVSKKGLKHVLGEYMNWSQNKVQRALNQLYPVVEISNEEEEERPRRVQFQEEEDSSSAPVRKRPIEGQDFTQEMRAWLSEIDGRLEEQALHRYEQTPEFQARLEKLLEERIDEMIPELRKQMELKVRRELEPVIREEVKKRIFSEVQAEVEPFRQKVFALETRNVLRERAEKEIDAPSFVSEILKKRKFTE